jgi:hypothetical protein
VVNATDLNGSSNYLRRRKAFNHNNFFRKKKVAPQAELISFLKKVEALLNQSLIIIKIHLYNARR